MVSDHSTTGPLAIAATDSAPHENLKLPGLVEGGTPSSENESGPQYRFLTGWRLHILTFGIYLGTFLVNLEISIVSTSLISITDDLQGFSQSSWIVTAYLLTYVSFMIIVAKLSDIFGRKPTLLSSIFVFTVFSGGCAAAQTIIQLIICRAFQGIGGCGVYSIVMIIIFEMVPPAKYSLYYTTLTMVYAFSMTVGPLLGGIINDRSLWIWVFLVNLPAGIVCMLAVAVAMPKGFPHHQIQSQNERSIDHIDFLGAFLLLAAMTMQLTGLEEAANLRPWRSISVSLPLSLSGPLWVGFFISQYHVTASARPQEPVFPWRFFQNRVAMGLIINAFLSGAISTTCMIQIPIRSQAALGMSAFRAGVQLIPFTLAMEFGAILVAILIAKRRLPPVYLALAADVMQLLGVLVLSMGSPDHPDYSAMYAVEVILGLGVGAAIAVTTLMMPFATEKQDLSVGTASVIQFRFLGGATTLAIVTAVANSWLRNVLLNVLRPEDVALVFSRPNLVASLPETVRAVVQVNFVKSFNLQMRVLVGIAAAQFPVTLLIWKKVQIRVD